MNQTIMRVYQLLIVGGIAILLFLLMLATPVLLNTNDFSIYNAGWNGCSNLAVKTYETGKLQPTFYVIQNELTIGQRSFADYPLDPPNATILIIGPRVPFTTGEGTYLKRFLADGGMLLVSDDFGTGNDILSKLNTSTRFSGKLLLDLSFEKNASFATFFEIRNTSHPLFKNVTRLLGNFPSSLVIRKNSTTVTVLMNSSEMSWLDENLNGREDLKEPKGPFPVLAIEPYGNGKIVLLSDPSLFINSMKQPLNNSVFRDNLMQYLLSGRTTVIIDESHHDSSAPFYIAYLFPSQIGLDLKAAIVLLVLVAFLIAFTNVPRVIIKKMMRLIHRSREPPKEASLSDMIDGIMEKHPSWSRRKLEQIVQKLEKP
jgi:hypothetical protein